ncbi:MAG: hypothetical protein GY757_23195 [bacterium]|nr:hypothetical protein [bacterium]
MSVEEKIEKYFDKRKIAKALKYLDKHADLPYRIPLLGKILSRKMRNIEHNSHAERDFLMAAKDGNLEEVIIGLLDGADLKAEDKWGTALFRASFNLNYKVAELLIYLGADINFHDSKGETILMNLVLGDNKELVRLALKKGANPFDKNSRQRTAKMKAKARERKLSSFITRDIIAILEEHEKSLLDAFESSQVSAHAEAVKAGEIDIETIPTPANAPQPTADTPAQPKDKANQ